MGVTPKEKTRRSPSLWVWHSLKVGFNIEPILIHFFLTEQNRISRTRDTFVGTIGARKLDKKANF